MKQQKELWETAVVKRKSNGPNSRMSYSFIPVILIVGLSGIVAQILILRELLISYQGNELTLGIIFANWVLSEALGAFVGGRCADKAKSRINVFVLLQIIFSLSFPLSIFLSRTFKNTLGIPFGQIVDLRIAFLSSFIIMLPVAFCHGALFSAIASFFSGSYKTMVSYRSIGKVYAWETAGTLMGGAVLTYFFLPYLNSFQIVFIISLANLAILFFFYKSVSVRFLKYLSISSAIFVLFLSANINSIQRTTVDKQWNMGKVSDYQNSIYGNITVIKKERQHTFFYNGIPVITTPHPDIASIEEFGHLPLLICSQPKRVLIISGGAGGLINEILKHPVERIDYVELDPLIINILKKHPSDLTKLEFSDKRLSIINLDGRFFLRTIKNNYDVILIGISYPSTLSTNRFFTQEFFSLIKKRLNKEGILAFRLPGSLTYLNQQLKNINACVLNSLKPVFNYIRIIPGDSNIFLASSSKDITDANAASIIQKMALWNLKTNILVPDYVDFKLNTDRSDWLTNSLSEATKKANYDFMPLALFELLVFWNKQFSPGLANILSAFGKLNLTAIIILVFFVTVILSCVFHYKARLVKLSIAYSIATTGLFGMLTNLILIFSFQVLYGYLYRSIGILISVFMAGIALGSIFMTTRLQSLKNYFNLLIILELITAAFSYCLALIITEQAAYLHNLPLLFLAFCFMPGFLVGAAFPLAAKLYSKDKQTAGQTAGALYCCDLLGGWIAAVFTSIVFLPILGLFKTCMIILIFKLSSLLLLINAKNKTGFF